MDGTDVGVLERGRRLRFEDEAGLGIRVGVKVWGQELDGDVAIELGVERLVDDAHPTLAQLLEYFVVGNGLTDHPGIIPMLGKFARANSSMSKPL
jgi:hypothetical protein